MSLALRNVIISSQEEERGIEVQGAFFHRSFLTVRFLHSKYHLEPSGTEDGRHTYLT